MDQQESLEESLEQYETQLAQIKQALSTSQPSDDKADLYSLKDDLEELVALTKETLSTLKKPDVEKPAPNVCSEEDKFSEEYALFKAELAELDEDVSADTGNPQESESTEEITEIPEDLQADLDALKGSKCQAPHKQQWGDESYHNALIVGIDLNQGIQDMNQIQVRVLFVNPTEKHMLPCPFYLDGECRFSDDKCHFSHGELVPLSHIREYREPDFSLVKEGSQVLAKQKDNLWHRAKVKEIMKDKKCLVQFESKGCSSMELDLHDLLPLQSDNTNSDDLSSSDSSSSGSSSDSENEEESLTSQEQIIEMTLLRNPASTVLGAWEKHTKGIGSRLMAGMGYVVGSGLGKRGEGRLEPVEALLYPPGKSLDACMALREAAGGDKDMFKAEKRQRRQQQKLLIREQQRQRAESVRRPDVFSFINSKLAGSSNAKPTTSPSAALASSSRQGLNVERFRLGEDIKKVEKEIVKINESLKRHDKGSAAHKAINSRLLEANAQLNRLQNSDRLVATEQDQRAGRKKISVF